MIDFFHIFWHSLTQKDNSSFTIGCLRAPKIHSARGRRKLSAEAEKECFMSYVTLEAFLIEKKQELFWELLKKLPLEEQIAKLKNLLLTNASLHHYEVTAFLWEALLHAVSDQMLAPLFRENKTPSGRIVISVPGAYMSGSETKMIHQAHRQQCAILAQEIYSAIPAFEEVKEWDGRIQENTIVKQSTLFDTKKALWNEVASWWRDTPDEVESLALFDWLLGLGIALKPEPKALAEIIRVHSGGMNNDRLLAGIMRIKQYLDNRHVLEENGTWKRLRCLDIHDWLSSLLHAWVRGQKPKDVADQLAPLAGLASYGPMAWDLLRKTAGPLEDFCAKVRLLQDFIKPPDQYSCIFGGMVRTVVRYEKVGEVIVEMDHRVTCRGPYDLDSSDKHLVEASRILGDWLADHQSLSPEFRLIVRVGTFHENAMQQETSFTCRKELIFS
jgi:hypothetical protein